MRRSGPGSMNRRDFIKTGLSAAAVLPAAGVLLRAAPAGAEEGQLVTEIADQAPMVAALQYVNETAKPDQNCKICQFYTAGEGGKGKCQLFQKGLVSEAGWCASYVKKAS